MHTTTIVNKLGMSIVVMAVLALHGAAWGSVRAIGLWGDDLAFAMNSNGQAVAVTDFLITSNIPFTRSVWANVSTP